MKWGIDGTTQLFNTALVTMIQKTDGGRDFIYGQNNALPWRVYQWFS